MSSRPRATSAKVPLRPLLKARFDALAGFLEEQHMAKHKQAVLIVDNDEDVLVALERALEDDDWGDDPALKRL